MNRKGQWTAFIGIVMFKNAFTVTYDQLNTPLLNESIICFILVLKKAGSNNHLNMNCNKLQVFLLWLLWRDLF